MAKAKATKATAKASNKNNNGKRETKAMQKKESKKATTTAIVESNNDENTVLVPQDLIDETRSYLKQIETNTIDMQKLGYKLGAVLLDIRKLYNGDKKAYGAAMTVMFPTLDADYRGSYIYMAENEKAVKAWLKETGKDKKLSSCRSIQRQHAASLKSDKGDNDKGDNDKSKPRSIGQLIAEINERKEKINKILDGRNIENSEHVETLKAIGKWIDAIVK